MTLLQILRDAAARIVAAREEFDPAVRAQIIEDLAHDLVGWLAEYEEAT
jgi:hypothetical protein